MKHEEPENGGSELRGEVKKEILDYVRKGYSVLVKGNHGIGKSHLLTELCMETHPQDEIWMYFPYCKPPKQIMLKIVERLLPEGRDSEEWKMIRRGTLLELTEEIRDRLPGDKKLVMVLDEIHTLIATAAAHYYVLMKEDNIILVTAGTSKYLDAKFEKPELKRFYWDLKQVDLPPLSTGESEELIEKFYDTYEIPKTDETGKVKRWILQNAKGNPLGIERAVEDLSREDNLKDLDITKHGAVQDVGVNLFPIFVILMVVVVAWRFLARGAGDIDLYAFTGFFGIIFYILARYLMYKNR